MLQTDITKREDPGAIWTDVNKRVLIDALSLHSSGRYSNLANAKGKWKLVVDDFQSRTGQMLVYNLNTSLVLQNLIPLQITCRVALLKERADDPGYSAQEKFIDLPPVCDPKWVWRRLDGCCDCSTIRTKRILCRSQRVISIRERAAGVL